MESADRRLLTVLEVAHALSLSRSLVFEEIRVGRLKSVKLGRARRVPVDYLDQYIELLKAEAATEDAA